MREDQLAKVATQKPDFLIIGAPRCGTTSLHEMLKRHPDIFMSAVKEPHYFSSFKFPFPEKQIHRVTKDLKVYQALFAGASGRVAGESSSHYLSDPQAPAKIKAHNPDMKLIAIVREPITRAYSNYQVFERRGQQKLSFYETVVQQLADKVDSPIYDIVSPGMYAQQLESYYKIFPKKQLLVVNFNKLAKQPIAALTEILQFLDVDTAPAARLASAKPQNQRQVPRNQMITKLLNRPKVVSTGLKVVPRPLLRTIRNTVLLKAASTKEPIDERAIALLNKYYRADERRLAKLLGISAAQLWSD